MILFWESRLHQKPRKQRPSDSIFRLHRTLLRSWNHVDLNEDMSVMPTPLDTLMTSIIWRPLSSSDLTPCCMKYRKQKPRKEAHAVRGDVWKLKKLNNRWYYDFSVVQISDEALDVSTLGQGFSMTLRLSLRNWSSDMRRGDTGWGEVRCEAGK